jgi:glycerophosphoryl diester phosphodiesterase
MVGMTTRVCGHRGWPARYPDNTLAGIVAATGVCDLIETDVRQTRDGVLVLSHDPDLQGHVVAESEWSTLAGLDLGDGHRPARLDEMLEAVGEFPINLEIKNDPCQPGFDEEARFAIEAVGHSRPGDVITSFHWPTMTRIKAAFPDVVTGLLITPAGSLVDAGDVALAEGHTWLAPHWSCFEDPPLDIAELHGRGVSISVWTVDDSDRAAALAAAGCDVVITNDPTTIREAIAGVGPIG